ncbi:MAG: transketolase [Candidatus Coproplasma sp.]
MSAFEESIQEKTINAIRILSAEQITRAKSGHPGICMGSAPIMYELYSEIMKYSPENPKWENRDRFILSAGHGSAMLYSTLHLFGFNVTKEDLMSFRQFGSKTPGHPEATVTDGVDCSTGALGQGVASAVGFALAEAFLAAKFNRDGYKVVDHYTYALCGEGCLEEGIGYEACSFAGTQKLNKLILFYDCNKISIEGNTDDAFTDDIPARFHAMGWNVEEVKDVNDLDGILKAVESAKRSDKPTVIICHSVIGRGTPVAGTATAHGTPLNEEQLARTKDFYAWTEQPFEVPAAVRVHCKNAALSGVECEKEWKKLFKDYEKNYPGLAKEYKKWFNSGDYELSDLYETLKTEKAEATRVSGGVVINEIARRMPNLLSGSADLTPSTKTNLVGEGWFSPENRTGRNIHFGIREHAMAAICNGVAFHGGLKIICSTFFVFADYMKGAMRIGAIAGLPVIYVLTHDGIGVGEDGPTHQPVEQLAMLRATPNIDVWRPCDRAETVAAFKAAVNNNKPTVIVLSRQNLVQNNMGELAENGAYVIGGGEGAADITLVATGSEVEICKQAKKILSDKGLNVKVVSMPCEEQFGKSKNKILSEKRTTVCVEASSDNIWYKYGEVIKMDSFGKSAPMEKLYEHYGFTPVNVADIAVDIYNKNKE